MHAASRDSVLEPSGRQRTLFKGYERRVVAFDAWYWYDRWMDDFRKFCEDNNLFYAARTHVSRGGAREQPCITERAIWPL